MLKITYLENGIYLEQLDTSVETWKADRILVNLRAAFSIYVESSIASIVLPITSSINLVKLVSGQSIELIPCDEEYLEVSLMGTWFSKQQDSEEGVFVCELNPEIETCLTLLWQEAQLCASTVD